LLIGLAFDMNVIHIDLVYLIFVAN
jgi:hypothetical protein